MRKKRKGWLAALVLVGSFLLVLGGCGEGGASAGVIGLEAAKVVALTTAGLSQKEASFTEAVLGERNGLRYYKIAFTADGQEYTYDIDAITGLVIARPVPTDAPTPSTSPSPAPTASPGGNLTETAARDLAYSHAGVTPAQVVFVQCKEEWKEGRPAYEVEFYTVEGKEYDYTIHRETGEILSFDFEAENTIPPAQGLENVLSPEEAKALALAQVPGATPEHFCKFQVDYEEGRVEYEGSLFYNGQLYEFEMDGYSGQFRSWESEPATEDH